MRSSLVLGMQGNKGVSRLSQWALGDTESPASPARFGELVIGLASGATFVLFSFVRRACASPEGG